MNEAEYKSFVESAYAGHLLIGVDRIFARKLYTDVSLRRIEEATGEAPYLEKFVVWFAFAVSPIAVLVSFVLAGFAFHWWSFLVIPVAFFWWLVNKSMSVQSGADIWFITVLLAASIVAHFVGVMKNPWMSAFFIAFFLALWCDRLLYCASTAFLRAFVLRNQRALEVFEEGLTIREATRGG